MSEPKFTPGPWHVGHGHGLSTGMKGLEYYPVCWSPDDENVCDIVYNKADADLIAAAPEMYELLSEILEFEPRGINLNFFDRINPKIDAVLRKARGESEVEE